ncbi:hsp70 nucleotide exchange factor fes1 [Ceratocystis pirilliformis]|uniref:Hsp70 nucleotide exchange factor fes1 n=1 Tax=Ceratocystis pirilliformis TaxID=259994 RepID=A0ABR3Z0N8_9PEZI
MNNDKNLNSLLKWSIENSGPEIPADKRTQLTPDIIASLMGGPSDAELMKAAIELVTSNDPEITVESKVTALDNFEQLIESLDNANNMANLGLWSPLLTILKSPEPELRRMAAWCVGTAVQNNASSQERMLACGGIPPLVEMALKEDEEKNVRKKAVYALSSSCRNYQPSMDVVLEELAKYGKTYEKINAENMDEVDSVILPLKEAI